MLAFLAAIAAAIAMILILLDKTGAHLENPLFWVAGAIGLLALHLVVPVNWPARRQ
jgi:hypothetical protein